MVHVHVVRRGFKLCSKTWPVWEKLCYICRILFCLVPDCYVLHICVRLVYFSSRKPQLPLVLQFFVKKNQKYSVYTWCYLCSYLSNNCMSDYSTSSVKLWQISLLWVSCQNHTHSPFILHSFTCRSSAPDTISGNVPWKQTQFTPRSWPSSTCFTIASVWPNSSGDPGVLRWSRPPGPGATFFFLKPRSQTF